MEQVFVVDRQDFFAGSWPQGFLPSSAEAAPWLAEFAARGRFVDREQAERTPAWKQLIPYCVIRRPDAVFCVQRKTAQRETRLHHLLSIGIGGHINPDESHPQPRTVAASAANAFFRAALRRELDEELHGAPAATQPVFQGLLNDDSNEVGMVHAGLVYCLDCADPNPTVALPRIREVSKMAGGFRSLVELQPLWQDPARFESWSRVLLQSMLFPAGDAGKRAVTRAQRAQSARPDSAERYPHG